ncbi:MAG: hypothetical protein EP297_01515 [Gammaproteobacteria bacterium]|nr:MAG: hypothetical protein EP297_01515 [Gammaproteobacteria bacterium]
MYITINRRNQPMNIKQQRGVTLVELMIGTLVGLIVIGGVLTVYLGVARSSADTLKSSRLNQEMNAVMNIMANDIRRSGFWGTVNPNEPQTNPFNVVGADQTALSVRDATSSADAGELGSDDCVLYTYDRDGDGIVDDSEYYGFKLNSNAVQMRFSCPASGGTTTCGTDCSVGSWQSVTDNSTITVTALAFNLNSTDEDGNAAPSTCINVSVDDEVDEDGDGNDANPEEADCYTSDGDGWTPASGNITLEIRNIQITMAAELANDSIVRSILQQSIRVRNDLVRER